MQQNLQAQQIYPSHQIIPYSPLTMMGYPHAQQLHAMPAQMGRALPPQPCPFLLLNICSMNPSASSTSTHKMQELKALIKEKNKELFVPFFAITETWLRPHISDAQVHISGYDLVRSDRRKRKGGGVLLYVSNHFPISDFDVYDDGTCQALSCLLTTL